MFSSDTLVARRISNDIRHVALTVGALLALLAAGCASLHSHTLAIVPGNTEAFDVEPDGTVVIRSQKRHSVAKTE